MQQENKQVLRARYREKRIGLSDDEFRFLNRQLLARISQLDMAGFSTVHLFLPIAGNREPDMYAVADWLRQRYPGIRLVLPKTERGSRQMRHIVWDVHTTLTTHHWGIPEPEGRKALSPTAIDAVLVPLLVVDRQGNRIGYGPGFYDRFLAECRPTAKKIGISLFEPVETISDVSAHDVALDQCVTPTELWTFNTAP